MLKNKMICVFFFLNIEEASKMHQQLLPLMLALFKAPNPVPVKTALQLKGFDVGSVRLPLVPLTEEERTELARFL